MGRDTNFVQNKQFLISRVESDRGVSGGARLSGGVPNFPYQLFSASQGRALSVSSRVADEFVP